MTRGLHRCSTATASRTPTENAYAKRAWRAASQLEPPPVDGVLDGVLAGAGGAAGGVVEDVLVEDAVFEDAAESLDNELAPPFLLLLPEYRSPYQPPPFRMKLPCVICRDAVALPHWGQSLMGSSLIRWTRSNSNPHEAQR